MNTSQKWIIYDGPENWTAAVRLHDRIELSGIPGEYVPDYYCILVQLKDYSNAELMEKKDELSVVMMIDRLQNMVDFAETSKDMTPEYLSGAMAQTPGYLLDIIAQVAGMLLSKLNVPIEEA